MEEVAKMSEEKTIKTFPLFVVALKADKYNGESYYAGPEVWPHWTVNLSKAKFYHTIGHANQAISYHRWKAVVVKHIIVEGELYANGEGTKKEH